LEYVFSQLTQAHGSTSDAPFFQIDTATVINGVTIPAGTYIKSAQIFNGTITNAKIGTAAIDSVKIADASIVTAKIADLAVETAKIKDANITTAKIANLAVTTAQIGNAAITNAKIGNVIQSATYNSGSAGWKIDKTGEMEMNNATFRGTLAVGGTAANRMNITATKIEIYNANVLRVKIGDLS